MQQVKSTIGKTKVSQLLPAMQLIAQAWKLNLSHVRDFNTAKRIVIHSAKWN